ATGNLGGHHADAVSRQRKGGLVTLRKQGQFADHLGRAQPRQQADEPFQLVPIARGVFHLGKQWHRKPPHAVGLVPVQRVRMAVEQLADPGGAGTRHAEYQNARLHGRAPATARDSRTGCVGITAADDFRVWRRKASSINSFQSVALWSRWPERCCRTRRSSVAASKQPLSASAPSRIAFCTFARSGPRNHAASGTLKPILGRYNTSRGKSRSSVFLKMYLPSPCRSFSAGGRLDAHSTMR